jgi:multimeric flavodoxin WrbA
MSAAVKKALVLDGSKADDQEARVAKEAVLAELSKAGTPVVSFVLRDMDIAACRGCFKCWTDTPGECIINDAQRGIYAEMAKADLIVLITPVTFGGYSYDLKKSLDRFIPDLLPFFRKTGGEVHHPVRYGNGWRLLGIGTLPSPDAVKERIFSDVVEHNSWNMHSPRWGSAILYSGDADAGRKAVDGLRRVIA